MAHHAAPLPHCVGAQAVDQEEIGLGLFGLLGGPTVHDGPVFEVRHGGSEARFVEGRSVALVLRLREAETLGHSQVCRSTNFLILFLFFLSFGRKFGTSFSFWLRKMIKLIHMCRIMRIANEEERIRWHDKGIVGDFSVLVSRVKALKPQTIIDLLRVPQRIKNIKKFSSGTKLVR